MPKRPLADKELNPESKKRRIKPKTIFTSPPPLQYFCEVEISKHRDYTPSLYGNVENRKSKNELRIIKVCSSSCSSTAVSTCKKCDCCLCHDCRKYCIQCQEIYCHACLNEQPDNNICMNCI